MRARSRGRRDRSGRAARAEGQGGARARVPARLGPRGARAPPRDPVRRPGSGVRGAADKRGSASRTSERCELVTVVGDAGVGKSRLAAELLSSVDGDESSRGRCLPYGEGITYWPVVEVIKQLDVVAQRSGGRRPPLRSLLGETDEATSAEEIAWAFRKLLEQQRAPLVCLFDDIQWAEDTFLDLARARRPARDRRTDPAALPRPARADRAPPRMARHAPARDAVRGGGRRPDPDRPRRRSPRADRARRGRQPAVRRPRWWPMAAQSEGRGRRPSDASGAARGAPRPARERGALRARARRGRGRDLPPRRRPGALRTAARSRRAWPRSCARTSIRPDLAQVPGDDAFRFRHLLIRDSGLQRRAQVDRAPTCTSASPRGSNRQAKASSSSTSSSATTSSRRFATRLSSGKPTRHSRTRRPCTCRLPDGGRSGVGTYLPAAPLLERALGLTRPLRLDVHLELDLADARGTHRERAPIAEAAAGRAREAGDRVGEALARVVAAEARVKFVDDPDVDELERLAHAALPLLEQAGDHAGLADVWHGTRRRGREASTAASRSGHGPGSELSTTGGSRASPRSRRPRFPSRSISARGRPTRPCVRSTRLCLGVDCPGC